MSRAAHTNRMGIQRSAALWVKKTHNVCLKRVKECQRGFCQRAGFSSARRLCGFRRVTASARLSVCLPPIGSRKQETGKQEVGSADSLVCISKEMTRRTPRGAGGVDGWVSQRRLFVFVGVKGRSAHAEGGRGRAGLTRGVHCSFWVVPCQFLALRVRWCFFGRLSC